MLRCRRPWKPCDPSLTHRDRGEPLADPNTHSEVSSAGSRPEPAALLRGPAPCLHEDIDYRVNPCGPGGPPTMSSRTSPRDILPKCPPPFSGPRVLPLSEC